MFRLFNSRNRSKQKRARGSSPCRSTRLAGHQPLYEILEQRTLMSVAVATPVAVIAAAPTALVATPADQIAGGLTTTTVTPSETSIQLGQSVSITAHITTAVAGGAIPTGTVTFTYYANAVFQGTVTAAVQPDGTATFTYTPIVAGFFGSAATYSGDSNYAASTAPVEAITNVNTAPETVEMSTTGYPTALITSQRATAREAVLVTNPTGTTIKGMQTITIYTLNTVNVGVQIGQVKKNLSIPPGVTKKVLVPINLALADGVPSYFVMDVAVTNTTTFQSSFGYTLNGVAVAAPYVALSATLQGDIPNTFGLKPKNFVNVFTLTNTGNETASGIVTVYFTGYNAQYPLGNYAPVVEYTKTTIKPGKTVKLRIHNRYFGEGTFGIGTFNLFMTAVLDGVSASANAANAFIVT